MPRPLRTRRLAACVAVLIAPVAVALVPAASDNADVVPADAAAGSAESPARSAAAAQSAESAARSAEAAAESARLADAASVTLTAHDRAVPATTGNSDPAASVDPLIGTSGDANDFPGADVPFGMVQWSPDTPSRRPGGGYEYADRTVTGFSLTHIAGPGCRVDGAVPFLPVVGTVGAAPGSATLPLSHSAESAKAGDYRLDAAGIRTELTSTTRSGMARFTYPTGQPATMLIKLHAQDSVLGSQVRLIGRREVAGSVTTGHFCNVGPQTYTVYFDALFDHDISTSATWREGQATGGISLRFDTSSSPVVQAKVGVSYVSAGKARANRAAENPQWDFDAVAGQAHRAWNDLLGRIRIGGGTQSQQSVFYTALYHALLYPSVISDSDGQYPGFDGRVHSAPPGRAEYTNISGWDVYRSQAQLEALVAPGVASDLVRSMLDQYDQTGQLPKWEVNNTESYVMVGDPADAIIADAYAFGARNFSASRALAAMKAEARTTNNVRPGLKYFLHLGYLPIGSDYGCCHFYGHVPTQLEYDSAEHAISSFAAALGDRADAAAYASRSNNWQNVLNVATGFVEPKDADGQFAVNPDHESRFDFVESDSHVYTAMVPHDIAGLMAAVGGRSTWIRRLDTLSADVTNGGPKNLDLSNEPSMDIPWQYDYAGAPYRTQSVVRRILLSNFTDSPRGMFGNDDLGTMSAWYVFAALGMYPEGPGSAETAVGSPLFPRADILLPTGKTLHVIGTGAAAGAPFVQSMTLNGAPWSHAYLPPSLVRSGGTVAFRLGNRPNTHWATGPLDAPSSDRRGLHPALGYVTDTATVVSPGRTAELTIGARSVGVGAQEVTWAASGNGLALRPESGTMRVTPGRDGRATVTVTAPMAPGRYHVRIAMTGNGGTPLPAVVAEVDVSQLGSRATNASGDLDGASSSGDFDGQGNAYSFSTRSAARLAPGASLVSNGLLYPVPYAHAGDPDNVVAAGQTVAVPKPAAGTRFGILGSSTGVPGGMSGTFVLHFAGGATRSVTLGLSDWTLAGGNRRPAYGNTTVAAMPYRDTASGGEQNVRTYLFTATAPIPSTSKLVSVTLPRSPSGSPARMHVFAMAIG